VSATSSVLTCSSHRSFSPPSSMVIVNKHLIEIGA
jgi:hypothetical protein